MAQVTSFRGVELQTMFYTPGLAALIAVITLKKIPIMPSGNFELLLLSGLGVLSVYTLNCLSTGDCSTISWIWAVVPWCAAMLLFFLNRNKYM
jgi:hypothetical protein